MIKTRIIAVIAIPIFLLFLGGCEKIIPDLSRDNVADTASGLPSAKLRKLSFYRSWVACRYPKGSTSHQSDDIIMAGDRTFLAISIKNICYYDIEEIKASFSCADTFIHIVQLSNSYYLSFSESMGSIDKISSWKTGWGTITNGKSYQFAPNNDNYSVEFIVSQTVPQNTPFTLIMNLKDRYNNSWAEKVPLTVK